MLSRIRQLIKQQLAKTHVALEHAAERQLILQATSLAQVNRARSHLPALHSAGFAAFSQWGEDGMIDWLVERIPDISRRFVEFGVSDYRESNTRLLLQLRNWRGLVIDGSPDHVANIRQQEIYWRHDLTAIQAFIDRDNINDLIDKGGMCGEIGLLSIDIDGNDYWVWQAIDVVSPAIVIVEFNATFGDLHPLTVPYRADFQRHLAHHSLLYFGASLPALVSLGRDKGYSFIGTGLFGVNAFFVRNDLAHHVLGGLEACCAFPTLAREARNKQGDLTFASGYMLAEIIGALPVVHVDHCTEVLLSQISPLYTSQWALGEAVCFQHLVL